MLIRGLEKCSVIDYPGKIAAVLFIAGCNFRCPYCHNPELVLNKEEKLQKFGEREILNFLKERADFIEAVCITGGEPTIEKELPEFIKKIKKLGFAVKIDTNGTNPEILKYLIDNNLVDYIAMDIKAPLKDYKKVAMTEANIDKIKESIEIIKKFSEYEFRITLLPELISQQDLLDIAKTLKGAKTFCLQQFRARNCLNPEFNNKKTYSKEELEQFKKLLEPYFEKVEIRVNN